MKRYIFLLCLLALVLGGCSEDTKEPIVTYEITTTEVTTSGPTVTEPTEPPSSEQPSVSMPTMP